jgi:O-antigen/teichoic acid export membrane protein
MFGASAVVLTANGLGVWGLLLGYYVSGIGDAVLSWALLRWRPKLRQASFAMWRELVRYGRWGVAANALQNAEQQIPVVLLGRFASVSQLGQFRYAARMESTAGSIVVQAAAYVLFPALARITENRDRFRDACLRSLRSMAVIGFPMGLILIPLGVPSAVIAFGEVWKDAGYAAMALTGVTIAGTLISFASEMLKADGRPDILTRIRVVTLVAAVVFMLALLPFDLVGVCAGLSLGTAVGGAYAVYRVGKQLEIPELALVRETLPAALAAIFMAAVLTPIEFLLVKASDHGTALGLLLLVGEALLGVVLYLAALRVVSPGGYRELISLAKRMLRRGEDDGEPDDDAAAAPSDEPAASRAAT